MEIIKIVVTRCHILRLKCTKFDCGWGFAPDAAGGAYSAPPDPLAGFKDQLLLRAGEGMGVEGKGRGGRKGSPYSATISKSWQFTTGLTAPIEPT